MHLNKKMIVTKIKLRKISYKKAYICFFLKINGWCKINRRNIQDEKNEDHPPPLPREYITISGGIHKCG